MSLYCKATWKHLDLFLLCFGKKWKYLIKMAEENFGSTLQMILIEFGVE